MGAYQCKKCNTVEEKNRLSCPLCGGMQCLMYDDNLEAPPSKKKKTFQYASDLRMVRDRDGRPLPMMPGGFDGPDSFGGGMSSGMGGAFGRPRQFGHNPEESGEFMSDGPAERDYDPDAAKVLTLEEIKMSEVSRISTGFEELDATLGGGAVLGGAVAVSGNSGLGKSTLVTQIASNIAARKGKHCVLYACGEESPEQIKVRMTRLKCFDPNPERVSKKLLILPGVYMEDLMQAIEEHNPVCVVLDSISVYKSLDLGGSPAGGVRQVGYISHEMQSHSQKHGYALFVISHISKDGKIAGPKAFQHNVDALVEATLVQAVPKTISFNCPEKNRFGKENVPSLFVMAEDSGILMPVAEGKPRAARRRKSEFEVHE